MAGYSGSTFDHAGIYVPPSRYEEVVAWYLKAFAPLGFKKLMEMPGIQAAGMGTEHPDFWVAAGKECDVSHIAHIAFRGKDHAQIQEWHKAAIEAGGKDNGEPGIRAEYHPNYYAAFIIDPVGNNIEVVDHCEHPEDEKKE